MNVAEPLPTEHAPRRILYVITKATWGGAQRYVYDLALASISAGYDVSVACGTEGALSERLIQSNVPVFFIPGLGRDIAPLADVRALLKLQQLMSSLQPDIIHANSSKAGLLATLAAHLYKKSNYIKVIFTAHGWAFNESRPWWQRIIFGIFHALTIMASDTVICVSEAVKYDARRLPFTKGKLCVIYHGIHQEEISNLADKQTARAMLAPPPAPVLNYEVWIGTLAELHPTKGLDTAIKAFAQIASQFPNTALMLIGEGQHRNHLVELVRSLGLQDRIRFCGHIAHAARYLPALDIFLFPSRSEALGYAALEAGNASLPIVASRVGGIPEIVEDGVSGLLISVDNVDGFAQALTSLLENPDLRMRLGKSLHDRVFKDFSHEQMLQKTLALYLPHSSLTAYFK